MIRSSCTSCWPVFILFNFFTSTWTVDLTFCWHVIFYPDLVQPCHHFSLTVPWLSVPLSFCTLMIILEENFFNGFDYYVISLKKWQSSEHLIFVRINVIKVVYRHTFSLCYNVAVVSLLSKIVIKQFCRYEKELMHPIQNLLGGELARAMLIQVTYFHPCSVLVVSDFILSLGFGIFLIILFYFCNWQIQKLKLDIETWVATRKF